jgi:hypothetical protein
MNADTRGHEAEPETWQQAPPTVYSADGRSCPGARVEFLLGGKTVNKVKKKSGVTCSFLDTTSCRYTQI